MTRGRSWAALPPFPDKERNHDSNSSLHRPTTFTQFVSGYGMVHGSPEADDAKTPVVPEHGFSASLMKDMSRRRAIFQAPS